MKKNIFNQFSKYTQKKLQELYNDISISNDDKKLLIKLFNKSNLIDNTNANTNTIIYNPYNVLIGDIVQNHLGHIGICTNVNLQENYINVSTTAQNIDITNDVINLIDRSSPSIFNNIQWCINEIRLLNKYKINDYVSVKHTNEKGYIKKILYFIDTHNIYYMIQSESDNGKELQYLETEITTIPLNINNLLFNFL